ncbi:unnamed protein product [Durusdinium trenchii]|uniref:Uncharacterized protein n=1 Tax=Durusdinium trenchii TaxID=1381693 RepID=A0ABP0PVG8_9DINO
MPSVAGKYVQLPEDAQDLLHFFLEAKPDWSADERRAVFTKLSAIQIRDVSGLLCSLRTEDLNAKLRAVGQKPFHLRTIQAFQQQLQRRSEGSSSMVFQSTSAKCFEATEAQVHLPPPGTSDAPNWEAPASAGWWRVVSKPSVWAHCAPDTDSAHISVHCCGKLLAMTQTRYCAKFDAHWLKLRDERSCDGRGQWILSNVGMAYLRESAVSFGDLLEKVCDAGCTPSREAQASHYLSVKAFQDAKEEQGRKRRERDHHREEGEEGNLWGGLHVTLLDFVNAAYQSTLSVGCHAFPYANPDILPDPFGRGLAETVRTLCSQSYVFVSKFLDSNHVADFVDEVRKIHEDGKMEPADPHQATSGQRDDHICWIDETRNAATQPAIHKAIKMLKAVAYALSPGLSQFHRQQRESGDPAHAFDPAAPASPDAVLTVPPKAMLSCYPGNSSIERGVTPREH